MYNMEAASRCSEVSIPPSFPVVLSLFLTMCMQVGTIKSMGIYLEDISDSLGTTSTDIGVALGLFTAISFLLAPLFALLYRLESYRRAILILGSCLIPLGVILTAFATNNVLISVYLTIAGLGHSMLLISTVLALDQHASTQHFDFLFGVGLSGFGLGMVLIPLLADVLRRVYGWRGGLLIPGSLMANLVPCTMTIQVGASSSQNRLRDHDLNSDACQERSPSEEGCIDDGPPEEGETVPLSWFCREKRKVPNSQYELQQKLLNKDPLTNSAALDQIAQESEERATSSKRILDRIRACIRRSDFYMDPVINVIFVATWVYGVMYCGWHAFLVPHAIQRGYSIRSTIIMTLFASIGNFLGRLFAGALSSRLTNPIRLYLAAALLNALAILSDVFIHHYYVTAVTACLSAVSIAGMAVLGPLALKRRASIDKFDIIYAVNEFYFGCGTFLGGYLSGLVGDIFSNYSATFLFLAGVDILAFLLMLPPLLIKKPTRR